MLFPFLLIKNVLHYNCSFPSEIRFDVSSAIRFKYSYVPTGAGWNTVCSIHQNEHLFLFSLLLLSWANEPEVPLYRPDKLPLN